MEFKKIDENKFQCLLNEEDLEDNNISLDDFFRNDTDKIHGLLDVVMEEARKSIGVILNGGVMSLQLAPQPNHSILLTVSSGTDGIGDMLKQAGQQAVDKMFQKEDVNKSSIIKSNSEESTKAAPFKPVDDITDEKKDNESVAVDENGNDVSRDNIICAFESLEILEDYCMNAKRTWGIQNMLYKSNDGKRVFLILKRGRCSQIKFIQFVNSMAEYCSFASYTEEKAAMFEEHYKLLIRENAVNIIKKYCER